MASERNQVIGVITSWLSQVVGGIKAFEKDVKVLKKQLKALNKASLKADKVAAKRGRPAKITSDDGTEKPKRKYVKKDKSEKDSSGTEKPKRKYTKKKKEIADEVDGDVASATQIPGSVVNEAVNERRVELFSKDKDDSEFDDFEENEKDKD